MHNIYETNTSLGLMHIHVKKIKIPIYGQDKTTCTYNNKGQCIELQFFD